MTCFQKKLLDKLIGNCYFIKIKKIFEIDKTLKSFTVFFEFTQQYIKKKTNKLLSRDTIFIRFAFTDHDGSIIFDNILQTDQKRCLNYYDDVTFLVNKV
jgi:hypothetical protein